MKKYSEKNRASGDEGRRKKVRDRQVFLLDVRVEMKGSVP